MRESIKKNGDPCDRSFSWYPGLESNQYLLLRTELFYPLNYRGVHSLYLLSGSLPAGRRSAPPLAGAHYFRLPRSHPPKRRAASGAALHESISARKGSELFYPLQLPRRTKQIICLLFSQVHGHERLGCVPSRSRRRFLHQ